jgi:general secretion pathway protein J
MNKITRQRGMTLIEVVVSIALLALLSGGVLTALRLGRASYERTISSEEDVWNAVSAQRFLRNSFERVHPVPSAAQYDNERFVGTSESMQWTSLAPEVMGANGHWVMRLRVVEDPDGRYELRVKMIPVGAVDRPTERLSYEEVVMRDLAHTAFSYRDSANNGEWLSTWNRPELPRAVRISETPVRNRIGRWAEFVAMPRVSTGAWCEFDVISRRCRGL